MRFLDFLIEFKEAVDEQKALQQKRSAAMPKPKQRKYKPARHR